MTIDRFHLSAAGGSNSAAQPGRQNHFVKAKVALEELEEGEILSIHMNDGEPVQNVPRSIKEEGHRVLKLIHNEDGTYDLIVQKTE